ncbi:NUDIX hydrolase [Citricoccus sp. SGAir0253]|uniref:NUDIX domain-containing protein n=1 Tax=Citricoccus sp. SGAir0253 TaxID=2567881 RepID=UPI0010CCC333|nr:NUDIX hydrolase [Citricoccus sp. SGAir0253]QCU77791.1 NUDIX hydrolase [Citricoccus sp. SGAir0253]
MAYDPHDGGPVADRPAARPVERSGTAFQGAVWDVARESFRMHAGGEVLDREFIRHPGAVAVVALDDRDRVRMIRQYRHPVGRELWEVPAGLLDVEGEPMLDAARRELAEEADLVAARWDVLVDFYTTPGSSSERIRVYLARDLAEVPVDERHHRTGEEAGMPLAWVPVAEAVEAVLSGRMRNPSTALGILALHAHAARGFAGLRPADAPWEPAEEMAGATPAGDPSAPGAATGAPGRPAAP